MNTFLKSIPFRFAGIAFSLFLAFSLLSRIALTITSFREIGFGPALLGAFGNGLLFDLAAGVFAAAPWLLLGLLIPDRLYAKPWAKWLLAALATFYAGILVFITTAEWFFWDEFGARFNFIAVDYLIWTQEVWGNISESYPMVVIIPAIVLLAALVVWSLGKGGAFSFQPRTTLRHRAAALALFLILPFLTFKAVSQSAIHAFSNQYDTEIAKNGCWSFFAAFKQMELDYPRWYVTLPEKEALSAAKKLLVTENETAASPSPADLTRTITATKGAGKQWNVILVCMESMSGSYMGYVGDGENRRPTPVLDRLREDSVFFENLYATGTRTVRGMEALTLNLPPTPGQAIIYRPEGTNLKTTFGPFLDRGYDCGFFYGGDGRFDFMNRYFSTAGCRIMDANAWEEKDTTFKTSWGACDEDLFNKTISEADKDHSAGKPFHFFCMTTSNHRPYDFPAGRIDLPSHDRTAAIKYADWAVGDLLEKASGKPWFANTLFVIVSDHCASSAGQEDIDVTKYRIPGMIYNPGLVGKQKITRLASQIDVMPTVFGLMGWDHQTLGYGHDQLAPTATSLPERAFVSNYQKIAMITPQTMTILKPNSKHSSYNLYLPTGEITPMAHEKEDSSPFLHDTTAYYQSASWLFNSGKLKR